MSRENLQKTLAPMEGPELVFGLVGALGSNLTLVSQVLSDELRKVGYESSILRVSSLLHEIKKYQNLRRLTLEESRIARHMDSGNELRSTFERGDTLALLAVAGIREQRTRLTGSAKTHCEGRAYILRSLKHPDEVRTLRKVYGRGFVQISAYVPKRIRKERLAIEIAKTHHKMQSSEFGATSEKLINRDEAEPRNIYGQNVRETFPTADVIINANGENAITTSLSRFIEVLFSHPFHTPTIDEYGMFMAKAASLRSSDLSRQVGAVIMTPDGDLVAAGCNEVPKAGGGLYWPNDLPDGRDFQVGHDPSEDVKQSMLAEILDRLKKAGWLESSKKKSDIQQLVDEALSGKANPIMSGAQIMNVLEFGRIVHAEMVAITDAARLGRSVKGATMYCTTFPCHMCARHIIASGIDRVVYVEPYPKSMAAELYPDSLAMEGESNGGVAKIQFQPFVGIAPLYYNDYFSFIKRKMRGGKKKTWNPEAAMPRLERLYPAYLEIETSVVQFLGSELKRLGLKQAP